MIISLTQLYNVLNLRSFNQSLFNLSFRYNYYIIFGLFTSLFLQILFIFNDKIRGVLGFSQITIIEFVIILGLSSFVLIIGEIYKLIKRNIK
ncbi:MAG: hypothetical protein C4278_02145 [Patescibacteria group bacterium]